MAIIIPIIGMVLSPKGNCPLDVFHMGSATRSSLGKSVMSGMSLDKKFNTDKTIRKNMFFID